LSFLEDAAVDFADRLQAEPFGPQQRQRVRRGHARVEMDVDQHFVSADGQVVAHHVHQPRAVAFVQPYELVHSCPSAPVCADAELASATVDIVDAIATTIRVDLKSIGPSSVDVAVRD
jgi:hypothetical protein